MEQATKDVIDVQIPHVSKLMQSGDLTVDSIDVFCEKGVFDLECTRQILLAGKTINLPANFHGDELHPMNAAEVCRVLCIHGVNAYLCTDGLTRRCVTIILHSPITHSGFCRAKNV